MKGRSLAGASALLACVAALGGTAQANGFDGHSGMKAKTPPHYYVALGDSLAVGYQPNAKGVGVETHQGYVNDLYAFEHKKIKNLKLVEFGCPGDTTTSLLTGKGNTAAAKLFHCDRRGGSQLKAAEMFLRAHHAKGEVSLVTLDIGANDVDACAGEASQGLGAVATCVNKGVTAIKTNTPKILSGLKRAAPKGTVFAAMNLYDPILADELSSDSNERTLGSASLSLLKNEINPAIASADAKARFKTANVARAFHTYDVTPVSVPARYVTPGGPTTAGVDVVKICNLTWMCAPAPRGPNIHANPIGYRLITSAFRAVLPKKL